MAFKLISIKNVCLLNALNYIQVCLHDKLLSKNENHRKINTNKLKSFIFEMFTNLYKKSNHHKKSGIPFENEKKELNSMLRLEINSVYDSEGGWKLQWFPAR